MREIIAAIKSRNIRGTAGSLESYTSEKDLVALAQFRNPLEVGEVIVRSTLEGPLVKVKDLAVIKDDFENERGLSRRILYQYDKSKLETEPMDYLEFMGRLTSYIPDKGQVMIRYYGIYSNAHRGKERKRGQATPFPPILRPPLPKKASPGWRELIKKVYEVDLLTCSNRKGKGAHLFSGKWV